MLASDLGPCVASGRSLPFFMPEFSLLERSLQLFPYNGSALPRLVFKV